MTDEDRIAAKLKGYNCLVKFKDGEELLLKVTSLNGDDEDDAYWFESSEKILNDIYKDDVFDIPGFAVSKSTIKYFLKI